MSPRKPKYTELTAQIAAIKAIRKEMAETCDFHLNHRAQINPRVIALFIERIDAALS